MNFAIIHTPIGFFKIEEEIGYITRVTYLDSAQEVAPTTNLLIMAKKQFTEYFQGSLKEFTLPIRIQVSAYHKQVLEQLLKVPYGQTVTYKQLAQQTGNPNAARAVGSAMRKNPLPIIIPCHRVLPASKQVGNYSAGGSSNKEWLLLHEFQNS